MCKLFFPCIAIKPKDLVLGLSGVSWLLLLSDIVLQFVTWFTSIDGMTLEFVHNVLHSLLL
jgi:hypothetical protein